MRKSLCAVLVVLLVLSAGALLVAGCGGTKTETKETSPKTSPSAEETTPKSTPGTTPSSAAPRMFTVAELATFNGQNGQPAYIAVDGVVYNVSGIEEWPGGDHQPCELDAAAGKDLSEILKQSPPLMRQYVMRLPVVGQMSGQ